MINAANTTATPEEVKEHDTKPDAAMRQRKNMIDRLWSQYYGVMQTTGFHNSREVQETKHWVAKTKLVDDKSDLDSIIHREEFFQGHGRKIINEGTETYDMFFAQMQRAKNYISQSSYHRWVEERFLNPKISFLEKRYWITKQMPAFVNEWIAVGKERDTFVKKKGFIDLVQMYPEFRIIDDREAFLDLHYMKKTGLLSAARAALLAGNKGQLDLYAKAKTKLESANVKGLLADGKVGMWLERIFKSNADPKKIAAFVNGTGANSLSDLMLNWFDVRKRYDVVAEELKKHDEEHAVRGLHLISETQFLSLHYTQRLRYVEEVERRLHDSPDPSKEKPIFLKIRHAMDSKDWEDAEDYIREAQNADLSPKDKERLKSMERYLRQFKPKKSAENTDDVTIARKRLDTLVEQVPSSLQRMYLRLLRSPNANRNINQFRWIVYNNDWCETHGYLNYDIARRGASKENEYLTKTRSERGEDVGRHDVLGATTGNLQAIRKREHASHKATFHHVDVSSGSATSATTEWLEREQDPRDLYWRTFIANEKGIPKSHNWHRDLFLILTETRSITRTLKKAGFMYDGPGRPMISLN